MPTPELEGLGFRLRRLRAAGTRVLGFFFGGGLGFRGIGLRFQGAQGLGAQGLGF